MTEEQKREILANRAQCAFLYCENASSLIAAIGRDCPELSYTTSLIGEDLERSIRLLGTLREILGAYTQKVALNA